jgi:hypothetical protein
MHTEAIDFQRNGLPLCKPAFVWNSTSNNRKKTKGNWKKSEREVITITDPLAGVYNLAKERINLLCKNVTDAFDPNETARQLALKALELFWDDGVTPSLINSSGDEGLFFEFFVKESYYLLKFCNSGEIVYLKRVTGQSKIVKEITFSQLGEARNEITSAYGNTNV